MIRSVITAAALVACSGAYADSYLCISDKMSTMTINKINGEPMSGGGDQPDLRFLITQNDAGDYEAGWFGEEHKTWSNCKSFIETDARNKIFCSSNGPFDTFVLDKNNTFVAKDITTFASEASADVPAMDLQIHRIIAGKCSAL